MWRLREPLTSRSPTASPLARPARLPGRGRQGPVSLTRKSLGGCLGSMSATTASMRHADPFASHVHPERWRKRGSFALSESCLRALEGRSAVVGILTPRGRRSRRFWRVCSWWWTPRTGSPAPTAARTRRRRRPPPSTRGLRARSATGGIRCRSSWLRALPCGLRETAPRRHRPNRASPFRRRAPAESCVVAVPWTTSRVPLGGTPPEACV